MVDVSVDTIEFTTSEFPFLTVMYAECKTHVPVANPEPANTQVQLSDSPYIAAFILRPHP